MRALPPMPAICAPIAPPRLAKGMDARAALAQHRAAFMAANGRLAECRAWYDAVAARFAVGAS